MSLRAASSFFNRSKIPTAIALALVGILLPTSASANAAMSLALTIFPWGVWLCYVGITLIFEAAAMGSALKVPITRALATSFWANLTTAVFGTFLSMPVWYVLGQYDCILNPNPFGHTLALLTVFGIGSGIVEASFWRRHTGCSATEPGLPTGSLRLSAIAVVKRCVIVHLIGVPVALTVLLAPPRPYPGLEGQVGYMRAVKVAEHSIPTAMASYLADHGHYPVARSFEEALQQLRPYMRDLKSNPDLWTVAYVPDFARFDMGERKRLPFEWNRTVSAIKVDDSSIALTPLSR